MGSSTTEYYVRPTDADHISCPVQYCPTVNEISDPSSGYLESHTIFTFLPGNHTLIRPLDLFYLENITLRGTDNVHFQLALSGLYCQQDLCYPVLRILQVFTITVEDIAVTLSFARMSAVSVEYSDNVYIKQVQLSSKTADDTYGLQIIMTEGVLANNLEINNMTMGVFMLKSGNIILKNSTIIQSSFGGVMAESCYLLLFNNLLLTRNGEFGLSMRASTGIRMVQVSSSWTGIGINADGCGHATMVNMSLNNHTNAIRIQYSGYLKLIGIEIANSLQHGIYAYNCSNISIEQFTSSNDNFGSILFHIRWLWVKDLSAENTHIVFRIMACKYAKLYNFHVVGGSVGTHVYNSHYVDIEKFFMEKMSLYGVLVSKSKFISKFNILISESGLDSMYIEYSAEVTMDQVILDSTYTRSLYIQNSTNVSISNIHVTSGVQIVSSQLMNILNLILTKKGIFVLHCFDLKLKNVSIKSLTENAFSFLHSFNTLLQEITFSNIGYHYSLFSEPSFAENRAIINSYDATVSLMNCTFINNVVSSIAVSDTTIELDGFIVFENISTESGAAFILSGESTVILSENSYVLFKRNHATEYGAAFYINMKENIDTSVYMKDLTSENPNQFETIQTNCFLRVEGSRGDPRLTFINNTADKGGDVLYGGLVASGYDGDWNCLLSFKNISDMSRQSNRQPFKRITSEPSRVCLCHNQVPDCLIVVDPTVHSLYPGETLTLPLVVVGQDFGTVSGFAHARLLLDEFTFASEKQRWVSFEGGACSNINYTINSTCDTCMAVLVLTTDQKMVFNNSDPSMNIKLRNTWSKLLSNMNYSQLAMQYISRFVEIESRVSFNTKLYKQMLSEMFEDFFIVTPGNITNQTDFRLRFPLKLYRYPLYIYVEFKPCPLGFVLSESQCTCNSLLQQIPTVKCDIQTQTVSHDGSVWVGLYDSSDTIAASQYCPLNYCKQKTARSNFQVPNSSDSQCNFRRSGVLCGGCQSGLSLALGSDQCLPCSNTYLLLILPFALAGLLVVFLIKSLDLTVCHGAINGIIFYANIINASKSTLFTQSTNNPIPVFISWFNLDLGIKVCFYDGLTAYARTWLQFLFPFYIWSIAGGIIFLARYSERIAKLSGNTGVPVLSTLFLLSYAKLFNTIISVVSYTTLYTTEGPKLVWSSDGNIPYLGLKHAFLFVMAVSVLLFIWLPYTLLLLFGRQLHKINFHLLTRHLLKLKPFLDANYAPLNSGHEYWFGVTLIVKATVLLASATIPANSTRVLVFSMAVAGSTLLFWVHEVYQDASILLVHKLSFMNLIILNASKLFLLNDSLSIVISSDILTAITLIPCCWAFILKGVNFMLKSRLCAKVSIVKILMRLKFCSKLMSLMLMERVRVS